MTDATPACNLPFERVPTCQCDPGTGAPPTKLQRLECKARRGPCSATYQPTLTELTPALPNEPITD